MGNKKIILALLLFSVIKSVKSQNFELKKAIENSIVLDFKKSHYFKEFTIYNIAINENSLICDTLKTFIFYQV